MLYLAPKAQAHCASSQCTTVQQVMTAIKAPVKTFSDFVQAPISNGASRDSSGSCTSCGGPHERRLCRFRAVQCRECGKTGHIAKVCRSRWQSGRRRSPEADVWTQRSRNAPRTNMAYCDDLAVTAINAVSQPAKKKVHVDVTIEGAQCQMEVDSGSTYSIISDATARRIFPKGCVPNLQPLDIIVRDYQANRIAVRGIGTVRVQFKDFDGQLCLVIVKGEARKSSWT
ncbi:hypothetical protein MTO96_011045 [Rhipicephalus appendiculatus]